MTISDDWSYQSSRLRRTLRATSPTWRLPPRSVGVLSILGGLLLWEFVARVVIDNRLFLVGPIAVVRRLAELAGAGQLWEHVLISGMEFAGGLALAVVVGIAVGILMATVAPVRAVLQPWVSAVYAMPVVALAPLIILWFGIGLTSKIVVVFFVAVFPVLVNTLAGVESTDARHLEMARSFNGRGLRVVRTIHVPSALPFMLTGVRLAVGKALIGVVVGELFGARGGLGYLILVSSQSYDMAALFGALLILAVAGVVLTNLVGWLERKAAPWRSA